jgi:molecular chaperone GrpE
MDTQNDNNLPEVDIDINNPDANAAQEKQEKTESASPIPPSAEELALEYKEQWIRTVAEMENLRKRFEKEKEDALKYAVTKFARDMLSVADNLTRALESFPKSEQEDIQALVEGLKLVEGECSSIFERHGIQRILPHVGEAFNADFHQAMFEIPTQEEKDTGKIAQIVQGGYALHGRLLRPALVGVFKISSL